ncbi:MAG: transporter substrate-binding domain-containing protein, partial [Candidatus Methanofastidiosia archaeon]
MSVSASENDKEQIIIAGDQNFPPFEYVVNEEYMGFDVDILNACSHYLEYDIELIPMVWNEAVQSLESGEIKAILGMKYTEERSKRYDFSKGYLKSSSVIFVNENTVDITSLKDLSGHTVAIQKGDVSEEILESVEGIYIIYAPNQMEGLMLLSNKEVSAFIGNRYVGIFSVQKEHIENIKIVGDSLFEEDYCLVTKKGDPFIEDFNMALENIIANGEYDKIYDKWFGSDILLPQEESRIYLIVGLFMVLVLLITTTYFWNKKKNTEKQRRHLEKVSIEIAKKSDINKIMDEIATSISEVCGFNRVVISLMDDDYNATSVSHFGLNDEEWKELKNKSLTPQERKKLFNPKWKISNSYFITSVESEFEGKGLVSKRKFSNWKPDDALIIPIGGKDRIIGFISVDEPRNGRKPNMEELKNIEMFANQAAVAIENASILEELQIEKDMHDIFISIISHDIKNPLQTSMAISDLIENETEQKEACRILKRNLEKIENVTKQARL